MRASLLLLLVLHAVAGTARGAETPAGPALQPLTAREVLASSAEHFPGILRSLAEQRAALGKTLEAQGDFDIVFSSDGFNRLDGFYDGRVAGAGVKRPFREIGGNLYGGYSISDGNFPVYEDEYFTGANGTLKIGALFSLLRDRAIDPRRAGLVDARLNLQKASLEVLLTRVGVQQRALQAYWNWVMAGQQLVVYKELLQLAEVREAGLVRQVQDGSRARIFITENAQNITRRQSLTLNAQRKFRVAALDLSFYLRDNSGQTLVPAPDRLPKGSEESSAITPLVEEQLEETLARRPELLILDTALQRARQRILLSENEMKPRLDLNLEYAHGFGGPGEGGISKNTEDFIIGFQVEVPLERSQARGRLARARARHRALQFERQQLEDRIEIELRNILLDLRTAEDLVALARREVEQARIMREAERKRFEQGASDFFLVNLREEAEANARIRFFASQREVRIARVNYDAAIVNLEKLGIDERLYSE